MQGRCATSLRANRSVRGEDWLFAVFPICVGGFHEIIHVDDEDAALALVLFVAILFVKAVGFGALAGKVWRIGLRGFSSRRENVALLLAALREIIA